jgi:hypothetical protein
MKKLTSAVLAAFFLLPISCNVYSPLRNDSTDEAHLEAGLDCLRNKDLACARTAYEKLSNGPVRYRKLCNLDLLDAGFSLSTMAKALQNTEATMLGGVANALLPYSEAKLAAASRAILDEGNCDKYLDTSDEVLAPLLKSIGYITHCALLIAKVDTAVATSNSLDDSCTTAGRAKSAVNRSDIADGGSSNGIIVEQGMCGRDALSCRDDIVALKALESRISAQFSNIKEAYASIPAAISTLGSDVVASVQIRGGIQTATGGTR